MYIYGKNCNMMDDNKKKILVMPKDMKKVKFILKVLS